jgi:hypothetical protein
MTHPGRNPAIAWLTGLWPCAALLPCAVLPAPANAQPHAAGMPAFEIGIELGSPRTEWTLGSRGDPRSELEYGSVRSAAAFVAFPYRHSLGERWSAGTLLRGMAGQVMSGTVRDSDFGRSGAETSRSLSDITGDGQRAATIALGAIREVSAVEALGPVEFWLGFSDERVRYRKQHGRQIIPDNVSDAVLFGLDSRYEARWRGPWVALATSARTSVGEVRIMASLHLRTEFRGEGEWNLRRDLQQPTSFIHRARGRGSDYALSFRRPLGPRHTLNLEARSSIRHAREGRDIAFLANGETAGSNLGHVLLAGNGLRISVSRALR